MDTDRVHLDPRAEQLARHLQRTLGDLLSLSEAPPVDVEFADFGLDSVRAADLADQISTALTCEMILVDFLDYPTIAELAAYLAEKGAVCPVPAEVTGQRMQRVTAPEHALVQLQAGQPGVTPLVLIHPAGGSIHYCRELVREMDADIPVYGIAARRERQTHAGPHDAESVDSLAARYVGELRGQQQQGPYQLAGSSFGGMVAFEMARQLAEQGQEVRVLALIDAMAPARTPRSFDNAALLRFFLPDLGLSEDPLRALEGDPEAQIRLVLAQARAAGPEAMLPPDFGVGWLELLKTHLRAMDAYLPRSYPGRALFYQAEERRESVWGADPAPAWAALARGGVEVIPVPGDHFTMMRAPKVGAIARHLGGHLARSRTGGRHELG